MGAAGAYAFGAVVEAWAVLFDSHTRPAYDQESAISSPAQARLPNRFVLGLGRWRNPML